MYKKVFLSPLWKFPISWIDKYYDNFNSLGDNWKHIIFTEQDLKSRGNIEVVKMTELDFEKLVEQKTGVKVNIPAPSPKFGDMRPAFGLIFEDFTKGFDFWGHTDFDMVLGDLDKFLTDERLEYVRIYANEPEQVNGIFALYRNNNITNNLFKEVEGWKEIFKDAQYHAFDENEFSRYVVANAHSIQFCGNYWQEHDKQDIHNPKPQLKIVDKALINTVTNEEIMCFHFRRTKEWPI